MDHTWGGNGSLHPEVEAEENRRFSEKAQCRPTWSCGTLRCHGDWVPAGWFYCYISFSSLSKLPTSSFICCKIKKGGMFHTVDYFFSAFPERNSGLSAHLNICSSLGCVLVRDEKGLMETFLQLWQLIRGIKLSLITKAPPQPWYCSNFVPNEAFDRMIWRWLEHGHCSITVSNHVLIRLIRFGSQSCIHL